MHSLIIAIIVLFGSCLATIFLDKTIYDCPTRQAEYLEKKMQDKKILSSSERIIPSGPCSRTSQRIRNGAAFVFCGTAVLLFFYGLLSGKFNIWQKKTT
jgi:hypothetical protein